MPCLPPSSSLFHSQASGAAHPRPCRAVVLHHRLVATAAALLFLLSGPFGAHSAVISLSCPTGTTSSWQFNTPYTTTEPWGSPPGNACFGNAVTGVVGVSSFSLYLYQLSGSISPQAYGYIVDAITNLTVAQTPSFALVVALGTYTEVTASFANATSQNLDSSRTYYLSLCNDRTGNATYSMNTTLDTQNAGVVGIPWLFGSEATKQANVSYLCPPSPSATPSPSTTPSRSASPTSSAIPSPTTSASTTPAPKVAPITTNVTSAFSTSAPVVNLTTSSSSSSSAGSSGMQVVPGQVTTSTGASIGTSQNYTVTSPTVDNDNATTSYVYNNSLLATGTNASIGALAQSFSFSPAQRQATFANANFTVPSSSVKWSIHISSLLPFPEGLVMTYRLSGLSSSSSTTGNNNNITIGTANMTTTHAGNITTYYLPLLSSSSSSSSVIVALVEVFDVALVDGEYAAINHSIVSDPSSPTSASLTLSFPAFNSSLEYDPTLGLGTLLGRSSDGGGGGGTNMGLIVGTAVAIPVAVVVVVGVVVVASLWAVWRRRRLASQVSESVTFGGGLDEDGL